MLTLSGRTMIRGAVIPLDDPPATGKPIISVTVANASDQQRSISFDTTVDTGFTGFLTLKPGIIAQLGLHFVTNRPAVLADGAIGQYDIYAGLIAWHGQQRVIPIYSVDSDSLVGMAMLWNSRLAIDVIPNSPVTIGAISS